MRLNNELVVFDLEPTSNPESAELGIPVYGSALSRFTAEKLRSSD